VYQQAVTINPLYSAAHLAMAKLYRQLNQLDYALTACLSAVQTDTSSADAAYELGVIYAKQKKYAKAVDAYQKVVKLEPKNYRAFEALGVAYQNLGNTDEAIAAYKSSIEIRDRNDNVYYRLAALYNKLGSHQSALDNALASLKHKPRKNGKAAFEAGQAYEHMNQYQNAIKYYKMAAQQDRRWARSANYQIDLINRKLSRN
jgi:tetratricopeptide (TPR) repeat protein